ncbi:restriction endonuclease subunit S [Leuconostoc pseudomesenteroides]|uniref:restriction endonuclease subunit S n=1 Tax=Leuconostoc pseudomesenteroides TaxID=33968 RepID=UPI00166C4503|nr:restriction endonuclease subunit S [Leuconostoc pseudomesenteroides]MCT4387771.1 hypothetical protein [Leuconostoc pseudomesenteroides]
MNRTIGNPVIVHRALFAIKNVALITDKRYIPIMNKWFLQYFKSPSSNRIIQKENAGVTQKFLALCRIFKMNLKVPGLEEQQQICSFFTQLDTIIALHHLKV